MNKCSMPNTEFLVSRLAFGIGMFASGWQRADYPARTLAAIRCAYEAGINLFDTADVYANGASEQALGEFIGKSAHIRDTLIIQSKCGLQVSSDWEPGQPVSSARMRVDLSCRHIVTAVESSLKRMRTDRMDVLLLHSPSPLMEPEEVAKAFDALKGGGKVVHFGVSGYNAMQIELLQRSVDAPLVANQIWVGLGHCAPVIEQSGHGGIVDYCRLHEIQVQAFSPLKCGGIFEQPVLLDSSLESSAEIRALARMLKEMAQTHAVTPAAIMLAWLLRHPAGIVPVIGASTATHITENCAADRLQLSDDEWQTLTEAAALI